jgi:hypothetical protein
MKKIIITLSITLGIWQTGISQGNLQFNRVINLKYTKDTTINGVGIIDTLKVPVNKVWKIESAGFEKLTTSHEVNTQLLLDNFTLDVKEQEFTNPNIKSSISKSNFPIWLSTGSYLLYVNRLITTFKLTYGTSLSIIEFNIVP